jgi:hypothetical protein
METPKAGIDALMLCCYTEDMTRATVAFDDRLYKAIKLKAVMTSRSVSSLVADAVRLSLKEDASDLEAFEKRRREPSKPLESVLAGLKRDGLL